MVTEAVETESPGVLHSPAAPDVLGWALLGGCLMVALVKIWLVAFIPVTANGSAVFDDRLFLVLAQSIIEGDWLGPYNSVTLAKGPFFPIWIAFCFYANIPLLISYHLLRIAACATLLLALKKIVPNRFILFTVFTVLVLDPSTYTTHATRVLRSGIYPSLTLFIVACLIGLLATRRGRLLPFAAWSAGLGLTLAAFWTTREEGIWMLPTTLLALAYTMVLVFRETGPAKKARAALLVLPLGMLALGVFSVCLTNYHHYGIFNTVEFKNTAFKRANGALMRVKHEQWNQYSMVPQEVRLRIYEVSPAFAELKPDLEGTVGQFWGEVSEEALRGGTPKLEDIRGNWFVWAMRTATDKQGHHNSAPGAATFYSTVADQIDAACDDGRLDCNRKRASMAPPWRGEYVSLLMEAIPRGIRNVVTYTNVQLILRPSGGDPKGIPIFEDLTRTRLSPAATESANLPSQAELDDFKQSILGGLRGFYSAVVPGATIVALFGIAFMAGASCVQRALSPELAIGAGLLLAFMTRISLLSYITICSFEALGPGYLTPLYPVLLLFDILAIGCPVRMAFHAAGKRRISA